MGRELQKKKRRSSFPRVKMKQKSKQINILSNSIIAANWDRRKTLSQNYKHFGLTSRLNSTPGGVEKLKPDSQTPSSTRNKLKIPNLILEALEPSEACIERDSVSGKILRVIHPKVKSNPLNDPISSDSELEDMGSHGTKCKGHFGKSSGENDIIRQLEEQAFSIEEKKTRKPSKREEIWLMRLIAQYGDNYERMARDQKLNPMQQTAADIQRRIIKWKASCEVPTMSNKDAK